MTKEPSSEISTSNHFSFRVGEESCQSYRNWLEQRNHEECSLCIKCDGLCTPISQRPQDIFTDILHRVLQEGLNNGILIYFEKLALSITKQVSDLSSDASETKVMRYQQRQGYIITVMMKTREKYRRLQSESTLKNNNLMTRSSHICLPCSAIHSMLKSLV